jgi:hypothetical protein
MSRAQLSDTWAIANQLYSVAAAAAQQKTSATNEAEVNMQHLFASPMYWLWATPVLQYWRNNLRFKSASEQRCLS